MNTVDELTQWSDESFYNIFGVAAKQLFDKDKIKENEDVNASYTLF